MFPKANHPAEFPGGSDELGKYLARHLKYPTSLLKSGIFPPPITVSFIVAETGAVENVEVIELRKEDQIRLESGRWRFRHRLLRLRFRGAPS